MPFARGPVLAYTGRGRYETVGPTEYVGTDDVIIIPAGFATDLATIPRIFWALLPPSGVYEKAAVVHDFGCVSLFDGTCRLSSRDVDGLFRRIVREDQELEPNRGPVRFVWDAVVRWLLWTGVRWGALANPARRQGWLDDLPAVVAVTIATLAAVAAAAWGVDAGVHALVDLLTGSH